MWTAAAPSLPAGRAGLTVTSLMVAAGPEPAVLALLDPDSDLAEALLDSGRAVVSLLRWDDRAMAEAFAGSAPAPGGPFRMAPFVDTPWGPRPEHAPAWAGVELLDHRETGWSVLVTCRLAEVEVGEDDDPLGHRRGRWQRLSPP
ncbi:flavin reductase [Nocardioides sp. TRM66260-LWL]|uniref:flavin reductase n=1 Tax=Nocardioides sp. TRM66260-LWL TaxID=2874478 RepID=UPI0035B0018C